MFESSRIVSRQELPEGNSQLEQVKPHVCCRAVASKIISFGRATLIFGQLLKQKQRHAASRQLPKGMLDQTPTPTVPNEVSL